MAKIKLEFFLPIEFDEDKLLEFLEENQEIMEKIMNAFDLVPFSEVHDREEKIKELQNTITRMQGGGAWIT